jgi:hypothetical protein
MSSHGDPAAVFLRFAGANGLPCVRYNCRAFCSAKCRERLTGTFCEVAFALTPSAAEVDLPRSGIGCELVRDARPQSNKAY